jgi:hypothetical protein
MASLPISSASIASVITTSTKEAHPESILKHVMKKY